MCNLTVLSLHLTCSKGFSLQIMISFDLSTNQNEIFKDMKNIMENSKTTIKK